VTPSRASFATQSQLIDATQKAVGALGLTHGPIHAELRHNEHGAWVLEVAARPIGGLCAKALTFQDGAPLEEIILRHAVGKDVFGVVREQCASGVMMIPIPRGGIYEETFGVEEASAVEGVTEILITATKGQNIAPLPEGWSYLGFIFAKGERADAVEESLRTAHGLLEFRIASTLPVT
jgi:L-amino acid ligase C-terminal domain 2/ATP-grasp domain